MKPVYLDIAVPIPIRRSFHYRAPEGIESRRLKPGIRIEIPFGRQTLTGILLSVDGKTDYDVEKIKPVIRIIDDTPVLDQILFRLCLWASDYYQHPVGEVLHSALPTLLRQGEAIHQSVSILTATRQALPDEAELKRLNLKRSPRQFSLLHRLIANPQGLTRSELRRQEISSAVSRGLVDKELAEWIESQPTGKHFSTKELCNEPALDLTTEQSRALSDSQQPGTHLIFGITGSGKTEVYLQAIEGVLKRGKQALVLVPEIGLTPQTVQRFKSRFQIQVCVLHSGLTDHERLDAWRQARQGSAAIIIGTRSAVFTPLFSPGLIVVDEEHDASFKQQDGFRYSARDLAVLRGQMEDIPVLLGSATPSLESYSNALSGKYSLSRLTLRPNQASTASYHLIGTQHESLHDGFSPRLVQLIKNHLDEGNQVLVFLNRRGFSPVLLCQNCGWIAECSRCDARMTYHLSISSLICHHCGVQTRVLGNCANCASDQLVPLGLGTQRLEQTLNQLFPDQKIIRIDSDSIRRKHAMEKLSKDIIAGEPAILVGTQLLAKGHHFPDVTLVAVVDVDSGFYSADYKAIERMGQLLLQVGGRAGREDKPGTVAVQTSFPDQPILRTLIEDGYEIFASQLLAERTRFDLPPYSYQAIIRAEATNAGMAMQFLSELAKGTTNSASVMVLGPVPSNMEKRAGKHRAQLLFSGKDRLTLQSCLSETIGIAEQSSTVRKVRWSVDVDPVDLF